MFSPIVTLLALAPLALGAPLSEPDAASLATTEWDVIVVGAGPAGIIVADRMSEAGKRTLLVEGGGPSYGITGGTEKPSWLSGTSLSRVDVPGLYQSIFSDPSPTLTCGSNVNAFGGCTIGGSSAVNAGLFFQPPASDWDNNNPAGWKSSDLASAIGAVYSRLSSTNSTSADGIRYLQPSFDATAKWLSGIGYHETDINKAANSKTKVYGHPIYDYNQGQRGGPVTTYLQTALKWSNFKLLSSTRVNSVARKGKTAIGVFVTVNGQQVKIPLASGGRVVLSGGALQSPAILMKSAIGDPSTLSRLAAANQLNGRAPSAWINNTNVGAGLFDNPNTFIELSNPGINSYVYSYQTPPFNAKSLYLQNPHSGAYTFAGETAVFWDTVQRSDGSFAGMQGTIATSGYADYTSSHTVTLNIYGTSGLKSRGKVVLDNNFIPGPDGNVYYSNPEDAFDIATYIRRIFDGLPSSGYTSLNIPQSASVQQIQSYITTPSAYARGMVNHWSSSCRFGTCIDTNAQVLGTNNIHVVDASIIPPLTVNPQFGVMIAAERASKLILALK